MFVTRPLSSQPIPDDAKCVFKGVIFDVYQWEQTQFDGSNLVFEKVRRADTVVVLPVFPDESILLSRQEQPGRSSFISALGGRVGEGEDPVIAAKRELLEESGYEADMWSLWFAVHPMIKVDWVVFAFIASELRKVSAISLDGGEKITLMPVGFDKFLDLAHSPDFIEREMVPWLLDAKYSCGKRLALREIFGLS